MRSLFIFCGERQCRMASTKILKSGLEDLKRITRADFFLCGNDGEAICSTFDRFPLKEQVIESFVMSSAEGQEVNGHHFFKITGKSDDKYVLIVNAHGGDGYMLGRIAVSEVMHFLGMGSERMDKEEYYQDLLTSQMVSAEIQARASKLGIPTDISRAVYCIETDEEMSGTAREILGNIFSDNNDYVTTVHDGIIVLIKEAEDDDELAEYAKQIISMLNTELMISARVTYGKLKNSLRDLTESYKEATMALEVAKIFFEEREIASYSSLGIGRIIHELPRSLCESFLEEIFGTDGKQVLPDKEVSIINSFFDNSLSIADTSRELDIPRSTLIYRIEKIQKKTGLDIRVFDQAMTLKIALMVDKYMKVLI